MKCGRKLDETTGRRCREELVLEKMPPPEEQRYPIFSMVCPLHGRAFRRSGER